MKIAGKGIQPEKSGPAPIKIPGSDGPRPWGGWGMAGGLLCGWMAWVFMWHSKAVAVSWATLTHLYDPNQYPGNIGAGPWIGVMAGHVWHLFAAVALGVAAAGWGSRAISILRISFVSPVLRLLLSLGLGFALMGVAMLGFGMSGIWYWWLPVLLAGWGIYAIWPERGSLRLLLPPPAGSWWALSAKCIALITAVLILLVALAPEEFYDSLVYHTSDPFNWIKAHKVYFIKYNFFSNFPFTFEMLFAAGMMLGSDVIARLLHAEISLTGAGLAGWMAYWLASKFVLNRPVAPVSKSGVPAETDNRQLTTENFGSGWIAGAVCLSTPLLGNSAWMTGIDAGLVLYEIAAVLAFIMWWEGRKDRDSRLAGEPHWLWLSAVFCGLGMGVKYTLAMTGGLIGMGLLIRAAAPDSRTALRAMLFCALALLFPFTLGNITQIRDSGWPVWGKYFTVIWLVAFMVWGIRHLAKWGCGRVGRAILLGAVFAFVSFVFVSPWNLKSLAFTGSPAFPFANNILKGFHVSEWRMNYQMGEFREYQSRGLDYFFSLPWQTTKISGYSNNSSLGGLFLALLPLLLMFRGVHPAIKLFGVIILGRYLLWLNASNIIRYFAPGLAMLGVLAGVYIDRLCAPRAWMRSMGYVAVLAFSVVNLFVLLLIAQASVSFMGVVAGLETARDYYLRERSSMPVPPYLACEAMNRDLPSGAKVLFVGDARGYFYKGPLIAATVFDFPPVIDMARESRTVADMNKKMRQLGAKYVFLSENEAQRTAGYRVFGWEDARQRALFEKWWTGHLSLTWKAGAMEVLEFIPAGVKVRSASLKLVQIPTEEFDGVLNTLRQVEQANAAGNYAEAEVAAKAALVRAPEVVAIWESLGQTYAIWGKDSQALKAYQKGMSLGLVSPSAHHNLAIIYSKLGRQADSMREFQMERELQDRWSSKQVPAGGF